MGVCACVCVGEGKMDAQGHRRSTAPIYSSPVSPSAERTVRGLAGYSSDVHAPTTDHVPSPRKSVLSLLLKVLFPSFQHVA